MTMSIQVQHLVKRFGPVTAINDISFTVEAGHLFAFLGANGAGKTTAINCLTTRIRPDGGAITVAGRTLGQHDDLIRQKIGVVFQQSLLDPILTVRENLLLRSQFYGLRDAEKRIDDLAGRIDLTPFLDRRYGVLSGGQKRRADIARALMHEPEILFLDEPTAGLDPASRDTIWRVIAQLRAETALTVFLTTHYMEETEQADHVCILDAGTIVAEGTPTALRAAHAQDELRVSLAPDRHAAVRDELAKAGLAITDRGDVLLVKVRSSVEAIAILKHFEHAITDFEFRHGTMDDVFLSLIGSNREVAA